MLATVINRSQQSILTKKGFKFGLLNINGLLTHVDQLRIVMSENHFDILAINETKLNNSVDNSLVSLSGYTIVRNDRNSRVGAGLLYTLKMVSIIT